MVRKFMSKYQKEFEACIDYNNKYLHYEVPKEINKKTMRDFIEEIHKNYNDYLLSGKHFEGCHRYTYCDCGGECYWVYKERRCSCGNTKCFYWDTSDVDWLKDVSILNNRYAGFQGWY